MLQSTITMTDAGKGTDPNTQMFQLMMFFERCVFRRSHTVLPHTAIASPALAQIKGICMLEATVSDALDSHREASGSRVLWETSGSAREIPRCFRKPRPTL